MTCYRVLPYLLSLIGLALSIVLPAWSQSPPLWSSYAFSHSYHSPKVTETASAFHKITFTNELTLHSQALKPNFLQQANRAHHHKVSIEKVLSTLRAAWLTNPLIPASGASPDNARVIVIEFFDYQCSFCRLIHEPLMGVLRTERDVRLLFLELPILGPASRRATQAALAAHRQNQYLPFHTALMRLQQPLNEDSLKDTIKRVGLNAKRLEQDKQNPEIDQHIDAILSTASLLGIRGTPTFFFGNYFVAGIISENNMRRLIALARKANHSRLPSHPWINRANLANLTASSRLYNLNRLLYRRTLERASSHVHHPARGGSLLATGVYAHDDMQP